MTYFFPAYNEEQNVGPLLKEALSVLPKYADRFEIIAVNDGSSDRTAEIVSKLAAEHPEVRLESHTTNLGYGHALRTGFKTARGDAVFFTDGDRQFRVDEVGRLVEELGEADVVVGYRIKRNDPWHRLFVARVYHQVLKRLFGVHVRDVDCAFKLFKRDVVDRLINDLESRSAFISPELVIRARDAGFRIVEVGVHHYPRTAGRPKGATPKVIARTIREIVRSRRSLGGKK